MGNMSALYLLLVQEHYIIITRTFIASQIVRKFGQRKSLVGTFVSFISRHIRKLLDCYLVLNSHL